MTIVSEGGTEVTASFTAERSATAALAWGQRAMWDAFGGADPGYHNFTRIMTVPRAAGPVDPATVAQALARLMARHDSLRSRVRAADDGEPSQTIHGSGRILLTVVESAAEAADAAAARLAEDLAAPAFDYGREWPLRAGVITCAGVATRIVLAFCHLAADGHAAGLVVRDLRILLLRGTIAAQPPLQLLDLVAEQQAAAQRRSGAALAHWEQGLRRTRAAMFAAPVACPQRDGPRREDPRPRYQQAVLCSAAMDRALTMAARRCMVTTTTVLTAAAAALVAAVTGRDACALTPIVSNRFSPRHSAVVTSLAQLGLLVVESRPGFDDLVTAVNPAALLAYRNAYYDQRKMNRLIARLGEECGAEVFPYCCFNDQRQATSPGGPPGALAASAPRAALPAATVTWAASHERLNCGFCLHVTGRPGELQVSLTADTCLLPRAGIEAFLRGMERLVVEAASRDVRLSSLRLA
jgi:hypothetical protein